MLAGCFGKCTNYSQRAFFAVLVTSSLRLPNRPNATKNCMLSEVYSKSVIVGIGTKRVGLAGLLSVYFPSWRTIQSLKCSL